MKQNNTAHCLDRIVNRILFTMVIAGIIMLVMCSAVHASAEELGWPQIKCFTEEELEMVAKTVWGEARGCSNIQQEAVAWCILNRVDDGRFPDSIVGVITQPWQFCGYDEGNPVDEDIYEAVRKVLLVWATEEMMPAFGRERVLPREYVYFTGDGYENIYSTECQGGVIWNWLGVSGV